jgi:hypothetical protein
MMKMRLSELEIVEEAIRAALVEIEQCDDISQGVEDDLCMALRLLKEINNNDEQATDT